ncbi:MAG: hypothetical protein PHD03_02035 [Bacilli bacterium]|nr:hypothetical protein [Bacilli bacterium]
MSIKNDKMAILIITFILFVISLIGVLLFYFSSEYKTSDSKNISKLVDFTNCQNNDNLSKCINEKYIDNKKINIRYEKMKIAFTGEKPIGASLYINNKEIISPSAGIFRIDSLLYITKNTILLGAYEPNVKNIKVYVYDFHGNKLSEVYELDKNQEIFVEGYRFEKNKIIFTGNKYILSKSVILHQKSDNKYVIENADLCQEFLASDNLNGSDIYKAEYEMEYLSYNKLGKIKLIPGTEQTLLEYLKSIGCNV